MNAISFPLLSPITTSIILAGPLYLYIVLCVAIRLFVIDRSHVSSGRTLYQETRFFHPIPEPQMAAASHEGYSGL